MDEVQSIAAVRKVLLMQGKDVENEDVFHYNASFTAPLFRIKINSIQLKETVEENKKTNDQVLQDRQYQVRRMHMHTQFVKEKSRICLLKIVLDHGVLTTNIQHCSRKQPQAPKQLEAPNCNIRPK